MINYINQRALVLGLGESGLAAAQWLIYCGARVRVADTRGFEATRKNLSILRLTSTDTEFIGHHVFSITLLDDIDFIVVSPGLKPDRDFSALTTTIIQQGIPVLSEIELFAQALIILRKERAYIPKVLAITGTNGKTTVASLTNTLCQHAGFKSVVAGNISPAVLEVLRQELIQDDKRNKLIDKQYKAIVIPEEIIKYKEILFMSLVLEKDKQLILNCLTAICESGLFFNTAIEILNFIQNLCKNNTAFFLSKFILSMIKSVSIYVGILPEIWVLELSSFQLHATESLQADAATVLNITEDHLDWHNNMSAYISDKAKIFGKNTIRILNRNDVSVMQMNKSTVPVITFGLDEPNIVDSFGLSNVNNKLWLSNGILIKIKKKLKKYKYYKNNQQKLTRFLFSINRLVPIDMLKIYGLHNAMNALAALALCHAIHLPLVTLLPSLCNYVGQSHRIELVANIRGVKYYNDSKATNISATLAALNSLGCNNHKLHRDLLLIIGGDGKGQDFTSLIMPLKKYCRVVLLIGHNMTRIHIRNAFMLSGIKLIDCFTLENAVWIASKFAKVGDIVLLSPACGSLDMFRNYIQRAEVFVTTVHKLTLLKA